MTNAQKMSLVFGAALFAVLAYALEPVLTPFLIAALLAYLGDPLVNHLTRLKLPRVLAVTLVFIVIMLLVLALLLFLMPLLIRQFEVFMMRLPEFLVWLQEFVLPWLRQHLGLELTLDPQTLKAILTEHWQQAGNVVVSTWKTLSQSGAAIVGWFAQLLLIPVVTFYLLCDWHAVVRGMRKLLPRRAEPTIMKLWRECDEVIGAFLRGQFLVMLALGVIYWIGFSIVGLDLALLLGIVIGLLAIVPYLGLVVGLIVASITALVQFHDTMHLVYILIVFGVAQLLENFVLTPWFVGDRIGLHPVAVIFAILAGGHLFGFTGILLALPVAAVLMVLVRYGKSCYLASTLYQ